MQGYERKGWLKSTFVFESIEAFEIIFYFNWIPDTDMRIGKICLLIFGVY